MKHFRPEEFWCPCGRPECDAPRAPHPLLLFRLDKMRDILGTPIIVTSGCRCAYQNAKVGGEANSEHLDGKGVDLKCETSGTRWAMVDAARHAGFDRLGLYDKHLHVGVADDEARPARVIWVRAGA